MSVIDVHRVHSLDKQHARKAAEILAQDLSDQFDMHYEWEGDVMRFSRSGVKGRLEISPDDIHVYLELAMFLRPFKSKIEQEICRQLDAVIS